MKKILYVDMDNVLVDFKSAFSQLSDETMNEYAGRLDEIPNIFSLMKPMPDAIDSFNELSTLFDTYVLSTSPWENDTAWSDKLKWIKKYLSETAYKRLILSHHKNLNGGDFIIDDRLKNGVDKFKGEHIHFGKADFTDWKSILAYLKTRV